MKKNPTHKSGFLIPRIALASGLFLSGSFLAIVAFSGDLSRARDGKAAAPAKTDVVRAAIPTPQESLATLMNGRQLNVATEISRETGYFRFVRAAGQDVLAPANASASPQARALEFLSTHGALVGMNSAERTALSNGSAPTDGSDLQVVESKTDSLGLSHVRLNQFYKGLRVFGPQLILHMNDNGITALNGEFIPKVSLSTVAAFPAEVAGDAALGALRKGAVDPAKQKISKTELAIYPLGLLEKQPVVNRLAYAVNVTTENGAEQVWVDAQSAAILARIPLHETALFRTIYSPQYLPDNPELFVQRREGDPPHPTPFVNNLYDFAGQTYNFYASTFGRDSYDGLGHHMISVYLINQQCPNAYWDGTSTNYCPIFDADDVVSHEWSHAYTEYTHGLIYAFQSGALNESYSDIFGESVDLLNGVDGSGGSNNAQPYPNGQRWLVGEDLGEQLQDLLLRDMYDPDRQGDPGKVSSPNYACGTGDGGGVHTNSGVPNHAYALIVDGTQFAPGGTYNGQTVTGIGLTKAAAIYFRAESVYQTPTTGFAEHATALQTSCNDLIGQALKTPSTTNPAGVASNDVINAGDCQQVAKAMLAVEMSAVPPCSYGPLLDPNTPAICSGSNTIFFEDWETGEDGWTKAGMGFGTGTVDWEQEPSKTNTRFFKLKSTGLPGGHTGTVTFAINPKVGQEGGGNCTPFPAGEGDFSGSHTLTSPMIAIPVGATTPKLSFEHYIASEAGVDGGQLEISVNGGAFALLPQDKYIFNAPNVPYNDANPVGNNTGPNPGEYAWTGTNLGSQILGSWGTTIADLSSVAQPGDTIQIRFTWSQDGCNGVEGWYIDNIRVFNCPVLQAPLLSTGGDYENPDTNGSYTLNWTRPVGASGPDVLQVSQSCAPLLADNANSTAGWTVANSGVLAPTWSVTNTKPNHTDNAFWAMPPSEAGSGSATLTYNAPIKIPATGTTSISFDEFYFNETGDSGTVEVSTDNGATWEPVYKDTRPMGDLPTEGASAFAGEDLVRQRFDLTVYSGKTIRLRFRYEMGGTDYFLFVTYGWYIDNILIENDSWADVAVTSGTSAVDHKGSGSYCYRVQSNYVLGNETLASPFSNVVNVTVAPGVALAVSRKLHGGTHDIPLPLTGAPGIECRVGQGANAGMHQVVFQFGQPATFTGASVTPGAGKTAEVDSTTTNGNEVVVNLKNVSNAQVLTVTLLGVNDGTASHNVSVPMGILLGDVNSSGRVDGGDVLLTRQQNLQPITDSNFREDVNASSRIDGGDVLVTRNQNLSELPANNDSQSRANGR